MTEEEFKKMELESELYRVKEEISTYDYIGVKIATGVATIEEYKNQIAYCETLRKRINELEEELEKWK